MGKFSFISKEDFEKMQTNGYVQADNFTVDGLEVDGLKFDYPKRLFDWDEVDYVPQRLQDFYSKEELKSIRKTLREHNLQDDGRVMISVICDGTLLFLMNLLFTLTAAGCTDIVTISRPATKTEMIEAKPFLTWYFSASGFLPEEKDVD